MATASKKAVTFRGRSHAHHVPVCENPVDDPESFTVVDNRTDRRRKARKAKRSRND